MQKKLDVFLAYNSKDEVAVIKIADRLETSGLSVWLDIWNPSLEYTTRLRQYLPEYFDIKELRFLCADLNIRHEDLPPTLSNMALELVETCKRRRCLNKLVQLCEQKRPHVFWRGELRLEEVKKIARTTKTAVILVGKDGFQQWEHPEKKACLTELINNKLTIIPVLLPGISDLLKIPSPLKDCPWFKDLQGGIDNQGIDNLILKIKNTADALKVSQGLISEVMVSYHEEYNTQKLDVWGIATIKHLLHMLSEIVALEAMDAAAQAANIYRYDILTMLVPLIVDLRWKRGYASSFRKILSIPQPQKYLRDFKCEEISLPKKILEEGVVRAEPEGKNTVLIKIGEKADNSHSQFHAVARVHSQSPEQLETIINSVNRYGRLIPKTDGLSVIERIGDIEIDTQPENPSSNLADTLYRNREALIPLIARRGMPGSEWLLPNEEDFALTGKSLLDDMAPGRGSGEAREWFDAGQTPHATVVKEFIANNSTHKRVSPGFHIPEDIYRNFFKNR